LGIFFLPDVVNGHSSHTPVTMPSRGIMPCHSAVVLSGVLTKKISTPMIAHAMAHAPTHLAHSRHSYRTRSGPDFGGFHGVGPFAKRWAKRWSAQRIMLWPNMMLKP